jgi:hypothetical protein
MHESEELQRSRLRKPQVRRSGSQTPEFRESLDEMEGRSLDIGRPASDRHARVGALRRYDQHERDRVLDGEERIEHGLPSRRR